VFLLLIFIAWYVDTVECSIHFYTKLGYLINNFIHHIYQVLGFICIFFYVNSAGTLHNLEYKESIDHDTLKALQQDRKHIFQGGNWQDLHRMLGVKYGDKILYVANHMFNDILR